MYTKPTLSALRLDVENNSCDCANSPTPAAISKLNPSSAACGPAFMTYQQQLASY